MNIVRLYFCFFLCTPGASILLLLCSAVFVGGGCSDTAKQPSGLSILGAESHDFGARRQGQTLTHVFSVVNKADVPIEIFGLKSSCACLVPGGEEVFRETRVAPNGTVRIPVALDTGGASSAVSGRVSILYRREGDPATRANVVDLRVKADILPEYRIVPKSIDFGEIDGLMVQTASRTIRVIPEAAENLEIQSVSSSSEFLSATLLGETQDESSYEIEIRLNASVLAKAASIQGSVILTTNSKRLPRTLIPVHVNYVAPVTALPTAVVISSDEMSDVERTLLVRTSRASRISGTAVNVDGLLDVEFDGDLQATEHNVRLVVPFRDRHSLNCNVTVEVEIFDIDGVEFVVRTVTIPVYRFFDGGVLQ